MSGIQILKSEYRRLGKDPHSTQSPLIYNLPYVVVNRGPQELASGVAFRMAAERQKNEISAGTYGL